MHATLRNFCYHGNVTSIGRGFNKMDGDTEYLLGVVSFAVGVTAIAGSYILKYLERLFYLSRTPRFSDFELLKSFLIAQPNHCSMVLIEGSVERLHRAWAQLVLGESDSVYGMYTKADEAGSVTQIIAENFKFEVENQLDAPRITEYRTSTPFAIRDSRKNIIVVRDIHKSIGFDKLLQLAENKRRSSGTIFNDRFQLIKESGEFPKTPIFMRYQEYILMFGTKFGSYGRASLQDIRVPYAEMIAQQKIIIFSPEEVGLSINSLINSHKHFAQGLRWLSWMLFVGGGFIIVFIAAPFIWKYLQKRRSTQRLVVRQGDEC